jgi:hypothetical protein
MRIDRFARPPSALLSQRQENKQMRDVFVKTHRSWQRRPKGGDTVPTAKLDHSQSNHLDPKTLPKSDNLAEADIQSTAIACKNAGGMEGSWNNNASISFASTSRQWTLRDLSR